MYGSVFYVRHLNYIIISKEKGKQNRSGPVHRGGCVSEKHMFNQIEFSRRVKVTRENRGMTQEQLADAANTSYKHLAAIEQGRSMCSIDLLVSLSDALGVCTDFLLKGTEPEKEALKDKLTAMAKELAVLSASV